MGEINRCLDLGCGKFIDKNINPSFIKIDEYYGIDILDTDEPNIKKCDLFVENIPFESNYFSVVTAFDFIEHVPRVIYYRDRLMHPFVNLMNEIYRVLGTGGYFLISVPDINYSGFWMDPTHINPVTSATLQIYFCQTTDEQKNPSFPWARDYGFEGKFKFIYNKEFSNDGMKSLNIKNNEILLQKI